MKKINKYIIVCMLSSLCLLNTVAQTKGNISDIRSNWYIEMGVGTQVLFSADASKLNFGDRITPSISVTGGKWFSPYWGIRVQIQGYSFNGNSSTNGLYLGNPLNNGLIYGSNDPVRNESVIRPDGSYRHYLRYMNMHVDFQVSLANLIGGYKPERKWDIIPVAGIGYAHAFAYKGTPKTNIISTNFSLMGKYKLPKGFDVNLEVQSALFPDQFDGRITGGMYESSCAVMLGVTYNFGSRGFAVTKNTSKHKHRVARGSRKVRYVQIINPEAAERKVEVIRTVNDTVFINKEVKVREEVPVRTNEPVMLGSILFDINKTMPMQGQEITFVNIAKFMSDYPEAKIRLAGYADQQTGTPQYNLKLSTKRGISVKDILVKQYNIDRKRIEVQGVGTDAQPYERDKWNRVVIVTAVDF